MRNSLRLRSALALGASAAALLGAAPTFAQTAPANVNGRAISEVVVTAQRRSEVLQDVPVAVSAFSAQNLKAQRLDGGENLLLAVPNVNYSRSNFGGFNLSIRGIGEKVTSGLGISGVSINENDLPLGANNFANTDFYDVSQVEVLRGPQGTLYGRNSTGGAVNVITNKPTDKLASSLTYEYGNYDSNKVTGFVNLPITDTIALRVAGFYLKHDGYGTNQANGDKIDGRDLGSGRFSLVLEADRQFPRLSDVRRLSGRRQPQPGGQAAVRHRSRTDRCGHIGSLVGLSSAASSAKDVWPLRFTAATSTARLTPRARRGASSPATSAF